MKVVREESLRTGSHCDSPFKDADDLVAKANDTVYGLAAGIWTKDIQKATA